MKNKWLVYIVLVLLLTAMMFLVGKGQAQVSQEPSFDIEAQMQDGAVRFLITKDGKVVEATCVYTYTLPGQDLEDVREDPHWGEHNCAVPENVPWMQLDEWRSGQISEGQVPETVYLLVRGNEGGWQEAEEVNLSKVLLEGYWVAKAKRPFTLYTSNDDYGAELENGEVLRDEEVVIILQDEEWSQVVKYNNGNIGWTQTHNLEMAASFTDQTHRYGDECRTMPISIEEKGGLLNEWLHEFKFNINLADVESWTLNFEGRTLERDEDYRSISGSPATFELRRKWLVINGLINIVRDRDWRVPYRWTLVYPCEG